MPRVWLLLLAAGALVLAGCFASSKKQRVVPLAPPCRSTDLRPDLGLQGATGSLVGGVVLRNHGTTPCSLTGRLRVRFAGGPAARTGWAEIRPGRKATGMRSLSPGAKSWVALQWSNWCPPGTPITSAGAPPRTLVLVLPHEGGMFRLDLDGAPRCNVPREASIIAVGPFRSRAS